MDHAFPILMRYVHIVSAVIAVGGSAFIAMCLLPATRLVDDSFRASLMQLVQKRFARVVWVCIGGLVISGVYNWVLLSDQYKAMGAKGNALIGTKVLLSIVLFAVVGAQNFGLLKLKPRPYLVLNLHLAAAVILLAAILRHFRLTG